MQILKGLREVLDYQLQQELSASSSQLFMARRSRRTTNRSTIGALLVLRSPSAPHPNLVTDAAAGRRDWSHLNRDGTPFRRNHTAGGQGSSTARHTQGKRAPLQ